MYISPKVLTEIMDTIGSQKPECGGILAADQNGGIADYYFDADAGVGNATYIPSRLPIQDFVRKHWCGPALRFCGVVHSHPPCSPCVPSNVDIQMACRIMRANRMEQLYLLMVQGEKCRLFCVAAHGKDELSSCIEEKIETGSDGLIFSPSACPASGDFYVTENSCTFSV